MKWRREARGGVWMVLDDGEGGRSRRMRMKKVGDHLEAEGRRMEAVSKITVGLIGMLSFFLLIFEASIKF